MLSFDRYSPAMAAGKPVQTGAFPQVNGDVIIRLYFPKAQNVALMAGVSPTRVKKVALACSPDRPAGVFEGTLKFDETMTGMVNTFVIVDGQPQLVQDLPIIWMGNRPINAFEVPDPEGDYLLIHDVPHGQFTRNTFWAHSMNNWERSYVYTPPGYMNSTESYPVLYLLHGGGDNELCWEYVGKISNIMDNLIAEKKAEPFIVVMCNDMLRAGGMVSDIIDRAFERMLIDDCIPYIENNYRVKTGKENRAIAGLSMGSFMTSDIGFGNPDLFAYVGNFTAGLTCGEMLNRYTYPRPYHATLAAGAEEFAKNYKLLFRSTTPQEDHLEYFLEDDRLYEEAGISALPCYYRTLYSERTTKWNSWRLGFRDFAKLLFR